VPQKYNSQKSTIKKKKKGKEEENKQERGARRTSPQNPAYLDSYVHTLRKKDGRSLQSTFSSRRPLALSFPSSSSSVSAHEKNTSRSG